MRNVPSNNQKIASRLREAAQLLRAQGASPYRIHAYRDAAEAILELPRDVAAVYRTQGVKGLDAVPHVGLGIASAVAEMLESGHWSQLDRLRHESDPAALLQSVPGIGPRLAARIHEELHVNSLEDLESAAWDGRLARLAGERRVAAWRAFLADVLGREGAAAAQPSHPQPSVEEILDVDREYRGKAAAGELRTIAPRRLNPAGEAWLPVMHTRRGPWRFTALFSNTALAHQLGRTRDWVVVYFHDGDGIERRHTVVTETRGPLAGRRVVRGREDECRATAAPQLNLVPG